MSAGTAAAAAVAPLREAAFAWAERAERAESAGRAERPERGAEPEWLRARRAAAAARFRATGFPTVRDEEWRFTPLEAALRAELAPAEGAGAAAAVALPAALPGEHRFVVAGGVLRADGAALPAGLEVTSIAEALRSDPDALEGQLVALAEAVAPPAFRGIVAQPAAPHAFLDLSTALFADGVVVRVKAGTVIEGPIHLLWVGPARAAAVHARLVVIAERAADATLVESFVGGDAASLTNAVAEIALHEGAVLRHVRAQQEGPHAFHFGTVAVRQARDANYVSQVVSMGAELARLDVAAALDGPGASCTLEGLYVASDKQVLDHHTFVDHRAPQTTSLERYKGIVDGAARTVFEGRIKVRPGARKTNAHQENRNLLLSDQALAHTKPSLEIDNDDVKCSHGATVGQLEGDPLFYLRSRGVALGEARAILTQAFAREVLDRVRPVALRKRLASAALARAGAGAPGGDVWEEIEA